MPKQLSPRVVLAKFESTCGACCRKKTPGVPMMPCPECRLAHYCNDECQERDRARHGVECPALAVEGFRLMSSALTGRGVELSEWIKKMSRFVTTHNKLPDGLTATKLEELMSRARVASCHSSVHSEHQKTYYGLLRLRSACARRVKQEAWDQEAFLSALEELLSRMPSHGPIWSDQDLMQALFGYGDLLCDLNRPYEAVQFGRRTKLLVEEAVDTTGNRHVLAMLLMIHGEWLHLLGKAMKGHADALQAEEKRLVLQEAETILHEALGMLVRPDAAPALAAWTHILLVRVARTREAFDDGFKLAQQGMQLPSRFYAELARLAIECLMVLRRDAQAELLIFEVLGKGSQDHKLLSESEHGMLHFHHSVLLCRRHDYEGARSALDKAYSYTRRFNEANPERPGLSVNEIYLQMLEVAEHMGEMDQVQEYERVLGVWALYRPRSLLRTARRWLAQGHTVDAMSVLRDHMEEYQSHGFRWETRARWPDGDGLKPLELLRDQLEEGSEERAKVEALIERTTREDEELKQQALEELQREMRQGRSERRQASEQATVDRPSKASRKKRKKRERKRQQRQQQSSHQEEDVENASVDVAALSLGDEGEGERGGGTGEEEQQSSDECSVCLRPLDHDEDEGDDEMAVEELLGCGHRFHDVCIDRWLCKCKEKGLLPTCPMCRSELVRVDRTGKRG